MRRAALPWLGAVLLGLVFPAGADEVERMAMARVRLSTEPAAGAGCTRLGRVSDDSVKDLRRKILRAGGNTGVLTFPIDDLSKIFADVFHCPVPAAAPPPPLPPGVPPPPPGPPPPPPPGVPR